MLSIVQPYLASSLVEPQGQRLAADVPIVIHEDFACPRSRLARRAVPETAVPETLVTLTCDRGIWRRLFISLPAHAGRGAGRAALTQTGMLLAIQHAPRSKSCDGASDVAAAWRKPCAGREDRSR